MENDSLYKILITYNGNDDAILSAGHVSFPMVLFPSVTGKFICQTL